MTSKKNLGLKKLIREAGADARAEIINGLPYERGFCKPPAEHRFKKGNTFGKRGRPKGAENLHTILAEEFEAKIDVTEAGKRKKLSKSRVGVRQLANRHAAGDMKATAIYFDLLRKIGQLAPQQHTQAPILDEEDVAAMHRVAELLGIVSGLPEGNEYAEPQPGETGGELKEGVE